MSNLVPRHSPDNLTELRENPHPIRSKLQKKLRRLVGRAIADFGMIEQGDRVMV